MDIQQTIITPEDASHLMEKNIINRLLSPRRVNALAQSISHGEWQFDGNPIRLTSDGRLLDGQHRLAAIIQADQAVPVLLIRGMPAESQLVIDTGRSRSFSDYLRMQGVANTLRVAASVRLLANIDSGNYYTGSWREFFLSNTALWSYYTEHREEINDGHSMGMTAKLHVRMIPSVLGVLAVLTVRSDAEGRFVGRHCFVSDYCCAAAWRRQSSRTVGGGGPPSSSQA